MQQLIRKCKNYERDAQRKMVDFLMPFLTSICTRYANCDYGYTKDMVQEALVLILNNIEKCEAKNTNTFHAWCRKIAINNCLQKLRKRTIITQELNIEHINFSSDAIAYSKLNAQDILSLLEKLPEQHRVVFNLAIIDGYKHREIAEMLDIAESSSRAFLSRARSSMQKLIAKDHDIIYITGSL